MGFVLDVFYQNYRRYVRSFDPKQMHDGDIFPGVSACNPFLFEGFDENSSLPENGAILPCGQISHSNFNDSFLIGSVGGDIPIDVRIIFFLSIFVFYICSILHGIKSTPYITIFTLCTSAEF